MEKRNINFTGEALLSDRDERTQDRKIKTLNKVRHSIYRGSAMSLFLILSCSIFIVEVPVMLLMGAIQPFSKLGAALLDSTLILVGIFPILYFFVFRPMATHITDRKQGEEKLRESEHRYRLLIETANEGILVAQGANLKYVNPMMLELTGYTQEELISLPFLEFVHHDDRGLVINNQFKRLRGEAADIRYQLKILKKDNSIKWVEMSGAKIEWEGQPATMNFITDITDRKKAEREIKLKNEELLKLNVEKDKFFAIIAHDLRSPFNGFLGLTQMMTEELPNMTMAEIQEIAVTMGNSATNLFRLLENLLQWAGIQQGLIHLDLKVLQLLPIIDESIMMMLEPAKSKGIEIVYDIPDDLTVFADSNILHTVIRNLVSNAVKFTHKNGKISVSAKTIGDKNVEISIQDTGIGMSRAMIDNLFRLDMQTNRKGTEDEPSSGLGLLLCKEFVEKHSGRLWAESEEGKGSVFHFTIMNRFFSN